MAYRCDEHPDREAIVVLSSLLNGDTQSPCQECFPLMITTLFYALFPEVQAVLESLPETGAGPDVDNEDEDADAPIGYELTDTPPGGPATAPPPPDPAAVPDEYSEGDDPGFSTDTLSRALTGDVPPY